MLRSSGQKVQHLENLTPQHTSNLRVDLPRDGTLFPVVRFGIRSDGVKGKGQTLAISVFVKTQGELMDSKKNKRTNCERLK